MGGLPAAKTTALISGILLILTAKIRNSIVRRIQRLFIVVVVSLGVATQAFAQIDPEHRELIQVGYNQPLQGRGPLAAYAFFYDNIPHWQATNLTLRLAVAPVYLDAELGISDALGAGTDIGIGISGGGFADNYYEMHHGVLEQGESFEGHSAEVSFSIYHLFNPLPPGTTPTSLQEVPLQWVGRIAPHYSFYERGNNTASDFQLPNDRLAFHVRSGLRWGGREPLLMPDRAVELSIWYDGQFRTDTEAYGFNHDRDVNAQTHLFWGRALLAMGETNSMHHFETSVTWGLALHPDRLSAFRVGGYLPLVSEFPLEVPGYYFQEFSAERFALISGTYTMSLGSGRNWELVANGAVAGLGYLPELRQNDNWVSGIGGGIGYHSSSGLWHFLAIYSYGFQAERSHGQGASSVAVLMQIDLERSPGMQRAWRNIGANLLRGVDGLFRR